MISNFFANSTNINNNKININNRYKILNKMQTDKGS